MIEHYLNATRVHVVLHLSNTATYLGGIWRSVPFETVKVRNNASGAHNKLVPLKMAVS
jgi:hypothetical protein